MTFISRNPQNIPILLNLLTSFLIKIFKLISLFQILLLILKNKIPHFLGCQKLSKYLKIHKNKLNDLYLTDID